MKKHFRVIQKMMGLALISALCVHTMFVYAAEVEKSQEAVLQEKRQAVLEKYSDVNVTGMSELDPDDPNFWIEFEDPNKPFFMGYDPEAAQQDPNYVPNEEKKTIPSSLLPSTRTTSNTKYNVYRANGTLKQSNMTNLFSAINAASGFNEYVKETDGVQKQVFKRDNNSNTYFRFQYTNFYDESWATELSPAQWVNEYRYAHVVDGTGHIIANSYYKIGGIAPDPYMLEPESGGYYYKFSDSWSGKSSSNTVDFSNSSYKFDVTNNNAYVYSAVVSTTQTIELGIMSSRVRKGEWVVYKRDASTNWDVKAYENQVVLKPDTGANYAYAVNATGDKTVDIKLSLTGTSGIVSGYISGPNYSSSYSLTGSTFSSTASCSFLQAASLPEPFESGTANLRCGSYLKNVKFSNCKLYSAINYGGTSYNFYPDSSIMNTAFVYCDDIATYSRTATNKETINIDYSIGYRS